MKNKVSKNDEERDERIKRLKKLVEKPEDSKKSTKKPIAKKKFKLFGKSQSSFSKIKGIKPYSGGGGINV